MTRPARSLPARNTRGGRGRLAVLLGLLLRVSMAAAQTLLPPDPSKTIGGTVALAGFVDEHDRDATSLVSAADRANLSAPWILSPIYTRCPYTCSPITAALRSALQQSGLRSSEYRVASFSFDPDETAESLRAFRAALQLPDTWLTLRAVQPEALDRMLGSLDFRTIKMGDGQYAHPNLIVLLAPDMRVTEYVFGVTFAPADIAAAVARARAGGSWLVRWRGFLFTFAGIGLLGSAFLFFTLLLRRRRA